LGITAVANTTARITFSVFLDSRTGGRVAGTYTYRAVASFYNGALASQKSATFSIVVAAQSTESKVASPTYSTAWIGSTSAAKTADAIVAASSTASTTPAAWIQIKLRNASDSSAAAESVTVTTSAGTVGLNGGTQGRSVVLAYNPVNESIAVTVLPDGTVGTATITISTPSVTFGNKTVVFYGSMTGGSLVATQVANTIGLGSNSGAITVVAKDASGNINGSPTAILIYSDATSVISETATACSFDSANQRHTCSLTGVAAGTANITIGTAGKAVVSAALAVKVTGVNVDKAKISFDKATYAPGEKGYILVQAVDSSGNPLAGSFTNLLAAGGISTTASLTTAGGGISTSDSLTSGSVSPTTAFTSSSAGYASKEPVYLIPFFAPQTSGTITLTATGGAGLPIANRVTVTASATVVNAAQQSADAALAAVTALATQVSAFITKINAQITTLTDLVMKIQKKVKA